jgi:hypothetical protein
MVEKVVLVLAIVGAIALWAWLGRSLGRGHLGVERTTGHYLSEQETRRHPF